MMETQQLWKNEMNVIRGEAIKIHLDDKVKCGTNFF